MWQLTPSERATFIASLGRTYWAGLIMCAGLSLLVLLAVLVGHRVQGESNAAHGFSCEQPCWQDFVPGVSTYDDVLFAIEESGLADSGGVTEPAGDWRDSIQWVTLAHPAYAVDMRFIDGTLSQILLAPQKQLPLGALLGTLGAPSHVNCLSGYRGITAQLIFDDGALEVWMLPQTESADNGWQITPTSSVLRITVRAPLLGMQDMPVLAQPWNGFVRANSKGICA